MNLTANVSAICDTYAAFCYSCLHIFAYIIVMHQISASSLAGPVSDYFSQVPLRQNFWLDFWIWPDLADFSTADEYADYLQLKVLKLVLAWLVILAYPMHLWCITICLQSATNVGYCDKFGEKCWSVFAKQTCQITECQTTLPSLRDINKLQKVLPNLSSIFFKIFHCTSYRHQFQ